MSKEEKMRQYIPDNFEADLSDNVAVFEVQIDQITKVVSDFHCNKKMSLKMMTVTDEIAQSNCFKIWYVFGVPGENVFIIPYIKLYETLEFPSVTSFVHEAWNYERLIKTFFGLTPLDHPAPMPIILHENWPTDVFPLRKDFNFKTRPKNIIGDCEFQKVAGEGVYEIPVGPIHAGIIEPGHFRFSVAGESIVHLEPRLGYTHKGSEKLFENLELVDQVRLSEKISGDSSFSHCLAFCQAVEKISNVVVSSRATYLRVIYAELERLANHFGDIGAIMMDTGFNFGGAQASRLREMIMRINEKISGSRFLRSVNVVGGVVKDINDEQKNNLIVELKNILQDFSEVITIAENSTTLLNRMKGSGVLTLETAEDHGVLGVAGRAVGLPKDARKDYAYAAYEELCFDAIALEVDGDVFARFQIRIKEVYTSIKIIQKALANLPEGDIKSNNEKIELKKNALSIGIVESWRGDIVYFVATDKDGKINRVAPRDPSLINWTVLGDAGYDNVVPDFPLINKSFNLSYTGNDL